MLSNLCSFENELFIYGGISFDFFMDPGGPIRSRNDHFMMKLDKDTRMWQPVTYAGAPKETWPQDLAYVKGMFSNLESLLMYRRHIMHAI